MGVNFKPVPASKSKHKQRSQRPSSGRTKPSHQQTNRSRPHILGWLILLAILVTMLFIRLRWLDMPLERDEGEYALAGQLLLKGIPPYTEAFNMKLPGTYFMYAFIMLIFGQTPTGIHIGYLITTLASAVFVFLIARRLLNFFAATISTSAFLVLTMIPYALGTAAHATHFVMLFALAGVWVLMLAAQRTHPAWYLLAGVLLGLSFVMKQSGLFFPVFGLWLIMHRHLRQIPVNVKPLAWRTLLYSLGVILPFGTVLVLVWSWGVFDKFWFWTFSYLQKYGTQVSWDQAGRLFHLYFTRVTDGYVWLWALSAVGFVLHLFYRPFRSIRAFLGPFVLLSALSVSAGLHFREHYFILIVPAVSLSIATALEGLRMRIQAVSAYRSLSLIVPGAVFVALLMTGYSRHRDLYFDLDVNAVSKRIYGNNPFVESKAIADFVAARTAPDERVLVFGSEPQIYFYADRLPATGYIYMYALMEVHEYAREMQEEMVRQVESHAPSLIVYVGVGKSWLVRPESEKYIYDWFNDYFRDNGYVPVGAMDITDDPKVKYYWNADARGHRRSGDFIHILQKGPSV